MNNVSVRWGIKGRGILIVLFYVRFFARSKEMNQRKGAQQLGLRLSSRNT